MPTHKYPTLNIRTATEGGKQFSVVPTFASTTANQNKIATVQNRHNPSSKSHTTQKEKPG
jgi:hypothetical protein